MTGQGGGYAPPFTPSHIDINRFSRPGIKRLETRYVVMHWTGPYAHRATGVRDYFDSLKDQDPNDDETDSYRGSNFIVDWKDGVTLEAIPHGEVSYTSGGAKYSAWATAMLGDEYTSNAPRHEESDGWHGHTPNWVTIDVEVTHPNMKGGEFTGTSLDSASDLVAWLLGFYHLGVGAIITHKMLTGKKCPLWWHLHPEAYKAFREQVMAKV
jgi:N-acetylmuramoyl-L-alanine amidase